MDRPDFGFNHVLFHVVLFYLFHGQRARHRPTRRLPRRPQRLPARFKLPVNTQTKGVP